MQERKTECLVLSAAYVPLHTVSWQRAFIKIFNGSAYAIEYYDEEVKTPSDVYLKPAVIVACEYSKMPPMSITYSKRAIFRRDNYECQYCGRKVNDDTATIDHVVPASLGGRSSFKNTVCACGPCNSKKGNMTLKQSGLMLRNEPRQADRASYLRHIAKKAKAPELWGQYISPFTGEKNE